MFDRHHHQRVAKILQAFDCNMLSEAKCFLGGGAAIVLSLGEYRKSVGIDFLCASNDGYRMLRNAVTSSDLGQLLTTPIKHRREVRTDQYKIYAFLEIEDTPVKVEIVREARVSLTGALDAALGVPVLSKVDLYCQKLLANADRGLDTSVMSRDIIDLAMMLERWGDIPQAAWDRAYEAYGDSLTRALHKAVWMVSDPRHLAACLQSMQMERSLGEPILRNLEGAAGRSPLLPA